jgi:hypothetical protein
LREGEGGRERVKEGGREEGRGIKREGERKRENGMFKASE